MKGNDIMSRDNLASIYYGFIIEDNDILFNADKEAVEDYVDDDWYIGEHYGQGFYYDCWEFESDLVLGVECYETEDILDITDYAMSKIVADTKEGLMEIYKELFPDRDEIPEPRFLLIQRSF
jgi:hypothetical protein